MKELLEQAKKEPYNTHLYWKLRCQYREKINDDTYSKEERDNCYKLWHILKSKGL